MRRVTISKRGEIFSFSTSAAYFKMTEPLASPTTGESESAAAAAKDDKKAESKTKDATTAPAKAASSAASKEVKKKAKKPKFPVFVKLLSGGQLTVQCQTADTIAQLKQRVSDEGARVDAEKQKELQKAEAAASAKTKKPKEGKESKEEAKTEAAPSQAVVAAVEPSLPPLAQLRLALNGVELEDAQQVANIDALDNGVTLVVISPVPQSGVSRFVFANGSEYSGQWAIPFGSKDKKRHGRGRFTYGGDIYDGEWVNDAITGQGRYQFASGSVFEGQWLNGRFQGKGTFTWPSGASYVGDWVDNRMEGHGVFTAASGDKFIGTFHNDRYLNETGHWVAPYVAPSVPIKANGVI